MAECEGQENILAQKARILTSWQRVPAGAAIQEDADGGDAVRGLPVWQRDGGTRLRGVRGLGD